MSAVPELPRPRTVTFQDRFAVVSERLRYPVAVYFASRVLYLMVAVADIFLRHEPLGKELRNWDGRWYVTLAQSGYPHTLPVKYDDWSTLGFEPLYSMLMWVGGQILPKGVEPAGLLISLVCGGIATVEMSVLTERWWGHAASQRSVLYFCFFPGTIVFSMVYSEGLTLALVAGCMLCLEDRRWVLAGLLAGAATGVEPVAFAIIPACALVSLRELWRAGWRDSQARRSLAAPILSVWGGVGTAIFMWFWAGTPLAVFKAQRIAWGEHSSPLAVYYQIRNFVKNEVIGGGKLNLNLPMGILGAAFMLWGLWWLWKLRRGLPVPKPADRHGASASLASGARLLGDGRLVTGAGVSLAALVYTFFVFIETFTSDNTPPNPRMLICAFPLVLAFGAPRTGRNQKITLAVTLILLLAMSIGSYAGGGLRP